MPTAQAHRGGYKGKQMLSAKNFQKREAESLTNRDDMLTSYRSSVGDGEAPTADLTAVTTEQRRR